MPTRFESPKRPRSAGCVPASRLNLRQPAEQHLTVDGGNAQSPGQCPLTKCGLPAFRTVVEVAAPAGRLLPYIDRNSAVVADETNQISLVLPATTPKAGTDRLHGSSLSARSNRFQHQSSHCVESLHRVTASSHCPETHDNLTSWTYTRPDKLTTTRLPRREYETHDNLTSAARVRNS